MKPKYNNLKELRERLGYTQKELAMAVRSSRATIILIENLYHYPGKDIRNKISVALGISENIIWPIMSLDLAMPTPEFVCMVQENNLRWLRQKRGFTVRGLSVKAEVSTSTIVAIEKYGDFPTAKTRGKIAKTLNVGEVTIWPQVAWRQIEMGENNEARKKKYCLICCHPEREAIDKALQDGRSLRNIGGEFNISKSTLHRHKKNCLN